MKGMFEEYGGVVICAITAAMILGFLLESITMSDGALHKLILVFLENVGARPH